MSALRAVWRFLASVPGMVYVALLVLALAAAIIAAIYHEGRMAERRAIETKARRDSIGAAVIVARDKRDAEYKARQQTDSARALTKLAVKSADDARAKRRVKRAEAEPFIASWPPLAIELIHADDEVIRADGIALQAHQASGSRWLVERYVTDSAQKAQDEVIALQGRQIEADARNRPVFWHNAKWAAIGGTVAVVLTFTFLAAR